MKKEDKTLDTFFRNLFKGFLTGTGFIVSASLILVTLSASAANNFSDKNSPNFATEANPSPNLSYQLPAGLKHVSINSVTQLKREIRSANKNKGYASLDIEDGVYQLDKTLVIKADYIALNINWSS